MLDDQDGVSETIDCDVGCCLDGIIGDAAKSDLPISDDKSVWRRLADNRRHPCGVGFDHSRRRADIAFVSVGDLVGDQRSDNEQGYIDQPPTDKLFSS